MVKELVILGLAILGAVAIGVALRATRAGAAGAAERRALVAEVKRLERRLMETREALAGDGATWIAVEMKRLRAENRWLQSLLAERGWPPEALRAIGQPKGFKGRVLAAYDGPLAHEAAARRDEAR